MLEVEATEGVGRCRGGDGGLATAELKDTDSAVGVVSELEAEIADDVEGVCAWENAGLWLMEDLFVLKFELDRDDRSD